MRFAIIIPMYNECRSIAGVIEEIRAVTASASIVIVNDCSTDNSADIARASPAYVIDLPIKMGAWGATQTGMRWAVKHGYDCVVTLDGDGQHDARDIPRLLSSIETNAADVAVASAPSRGSFMRHVAWSTLRFASGLTESDLTSGFKAYNRTAIRLMISFEATLLDYQDVGLLLLLKSHRLRVLDIPTAMRQRADGGSRIFSSWFIVLGYLLETLVISFAKRNIKNGVAK